MVHIGVDLGSQQSFYCVRSKNGEIVTEDSIFTTALNLLFQEYPKKTRVILESCTESQAVAEMAEECGLDVRIVPATLVRQLGVGHRGIKTDQRDARALSLASCRLELVGIYRRCEQSRKRLRLITNREALVTARTQLVNCVRAYLRSKLISVKSSTDKFHSAIRNRLNEVPDDIEQLLRSIETLTREIVKATQSIQEISEADPTCKRLKTIHGVGPITSVTFAAVIEDPSRFPNASHATSYLGITPGESSSSTKKKRTGITKAGPALARKYLVQAGLSMRRTKREKVGPIKDWAKELKKRRGGQVANVAVARKIAGIMYAMMRDGTEYHPEMSAKALNSER